MQGRLAQILHDHFQQLVSAAKLKAGLLRRKMDEESSVQSLRQVESLLEEAIAASRMATVMKPAGAPRRRPDRGAAVACAAHGAGPPVERGTDG